jgi:hypothetical protein
VAAAFQLARSGDDGEFLGVADIDRMGIRAELDDGVGLGGRMGVHADVLKPSLHPGK